MALQDRLDALEPRERRLVFILLAIFAGMVLLLIPFAVSAVLSDENETHARLSEAIERLETEGDAIRDRQDARQALLERYESPAPALAGFLDKAASASAVTIPESQELSPVAHGKRYEERSRSIQVRKVNVRKRGVEPDSYDVQMTVSAYHRLQPKAKTEEEQP
jgi:hypothetical protein